MNYRKKKLYNSVCIYCFNATLKKKKLILGQMVYSVRMQCGRELALESPVEADIVSSVPESGTAAAHGYAREVNELILSFAMLPAININFRLTLFQ